MYSLAGKFREIFDLESSGRLILYSVLVGVVAGLGAAGFYWCLDHLEDLVLGQLMGFAASEAADEVSMDPSDLSSHWWIILAVPTLGGLACGWLVYTFAPEAEGHGTDAMVRAFHSVKGTIRARVPLLKAVASLMTIGSGGSAGREGPIAQIGAGFGSFLATRLKLSDSDRRMLMLAGAAGGIGAIFRAPLGGALFAVEVLYASTAIEFAALVPCVFAAIVAYSVFCGIFGFGLTFTTPALAFHGAHELPFYLVFAVVCALVGFLYVTVFYETRERLFRKLPISNMFKPAIGGFLLGLLILYMPQVMAGGYGWIQQAIDGKLTISLMAALVGAKILATSFTISSGGSGGVFAPSLFIGAMLGGAFGMGCHALFPEWIVQPEAFVLVGMGGFFAGVAKVPLTALLMVSEMSGSYDLLVPLMLVSTVNVAILSQRWTLYEEQVSSLVDSPAHLGDFVVDVLEDTEVREVYDPRRPPTLIREDLPLSRMLQLVAHSDDTNFPVIDSANQLVGVFSLGDIRSTFVGTDASHLILASDLATHDVVTVTPDDNLLTVLRIYTQKQIAEVPVVDPNDPNRVICMLPRGRVIAAYDQKMNALRTGKA